MSNLAIGVIGGTFDPIHLGHVSLAKQVLEKCNLQSIRFIPCGIPPHRAQPIASSKERLNMLNLSIKNYSEFVADDCEIKRQGITRTIDTVRFLREQFPENSINFIMAYDAFLNFNTWYEYKSILDYSNIIVTNRPGIELYLNDDLKELLNLHYQKDIELIHEKQYGNIFIITINPLPISASSIRNKIANKEDISKLISKEVYDYIKEKHLYY
jgi:nicotinate-nucleotide adenylyltransferase